MDILNKTVIVCVSGIHFPVYCYDIRQKNGFSKYAGIRLRHTNNDLGLDLDFYGSVQAYVEIFDATNVVRILTDSMPEKGHALRSREKLIRSAPHIIRLFSAPGITTLYKMLKSRENRGYTTTFRTIRKMLALNFSAWDETNKKLAAFPDNSAYLQEIILNTLNSAVENISRCTDICVSVCKREDRPDQTGLDGRLTFSVTANEQYFPLKFSVPDICKKYRQFWEIDKRIRNLKPSANGRIPSKGLNRQRRKLARELGLSINADREARDLARQLRARTAPLAPSDESSGKKRVDKAKAYKAII